MMERQYLIVNPIQSNPMCSRWVWTTATATRASFASSTALMTWVTQILNMMEPQRHVVAWIEYYDETCCCLDLIKCCCSKLGWNWSICITHLYSIESSQIVARYHHHELCAPKDETWSTEGAKTGWHHAATSGVSPVCELRPANRCDHKLALWSIMWEVGWEPSSQSTNSNTNANTNTSTYKYKLVLNMWKV